MARVCEVTGKKTTRGYKYTIRGIAKKKKGIGLKVTGKTKRRFLPNLQTKRFWCPEKKQFMTLSVSANGMRIIDKLGLSKALKRQAV
jgi:large subunit ribosomal protein L28